MSAVTATRIQLRAGWKAPVIWLASLGLTFVFTVVAIIDLYGNDGDYSGYAATVASTPAMAAINGTPYGADTLGGVISNEFGFFVAVAIPLMGVLLVVSRTRKAEENGLMELVLSRSIGRRDPWIAAILVAFATEILLGAVLFGTEVAYGIPVAAAGMYGASIAALGAVFSGLAVLVGQLVNRGAAVTGIGVLILGLTYVSRAVGDVRDNAWKWLSPLAWQQETRPFTDDMRIWPLVLLVALAAALTIAGLVLVTSRDLGAAIMPSGKGSATAGPELRSRIGLTLHLHGWTTTAWALGTLTIGAVFGIFTGDIADIVKQNPELAYAFGEGAFEDAYVAIMAQLLGLMAIGAAAQATIRLREEETRGHLEPTLVSLTSRYGWIMPQFGAVLAAATFTHLAGGLGMWLSARNDADGIWTATFSQLPAVLFLSAIGLALFAIVPKLTQLLWAPFAYVALVAMLGPTLNMPEWSMKASPIYAIGNVPAVDASDTALWACSIATVALTIAAVIAMRARDVPR